MPGALPHPLRLPGDPQWEREHPLTRLELALAVVQHAPARVHDNGSAAADPRGPARSLSVLEKVNRFERAGMQRSHSTCNHLRVT